MLTRLADARLGGGERDEAIALYRASLAVDPAQPTAWFNLGWALRASRRFDEALTAYGEAIAFGLDRREEALLNRAAILSDHLFRPDLAIGELDRAIELRPDFLPALLSLGAIQEDRGDVDAARHAYRRAIAVAPASGRAAARLGMVTSAAGDPAGASRLLTDALDRATDPENRAEILFALGESLDQLGRFDEAFSAVEAANWITRSRSPRRYDPRRQEELTDRLIATFADRQPEATASAGAPVPLFICGMFRSGSTLAERLLCRHAAIDTAGELEVIPALAGSLSPYPESVPSLAADLLGPVRDGYRRSLPRSPCVIDKRCDNVLHLGLVRRLFPEGRIVHTRRDPLDNLLSIYFLHFGEEIGYGNDLLEAAHYYVQYRRLIRHWQERVFPDIIDLDYDRLVLDPQATLGPVIGALGLGWDEALLSPTGKPATVRTASTWQVRKPLYARSSGRWRHYAKYLAEPRRLLAAAGV